ncbi:MAG: BamA/TamA family outer membrane protein [Bacteroidota bacterium]
MKNIVTAFPVLFLILFICFTNPLKAQDQEGRDFDKRLDSTLQNIYRSIDEQMGTYIFTDEPQSRQYKENSTDDDTDNPINVNKYNRRYSRLSSYPYTTTTKDFYPPFLRINSLAYYPWENMSDDLLFRYNRVEGVFLGLNSPKKYHWDSHHIDLFGSGGYGFANHRWRYNGGIAEQFGTGEHMFEFGVEGHSLTDTEDKWIVSQMENNFSSIVARDDYRDYFGRDGFSVWTGFYREPSSWGYQLEAAYQIDRYESMDRRTNWSLFGGDKLFHDNPPIDEGHMRSILATFEIQQLQTHKIFSTGWSAALSAEHAGTELSSDFDFNRYQIDLRRYQPFSRYDNLNLRLRAGASNGGVPLQKLFYVGGISTLPAFGYKDFSGNRLLLANAEYLVNGNLFDDDDLFPSWLFRNVNLILFMDAGYVASSPENSIIRGFENLNHSTVKSDYGFGFGTRDAKFRIGFAWRTDLAEPVHVFIRLDRPF